MKFTATVPLRCPAVVSLMPTAMLALSLPPPARPAIEPVAVTPAPGVPNSPAKASVYAAAGRRVRNRQGPRAKTVAEMNAAQIDRRVKRIGPRKPYTSPVTANDCDARGVSVSPVPP